MPKYDYELPQEISDRKLKKLLSDLGLTVTPRYRATLLAFSHRTRRQKINELLDEKVASLKVMKTAKASKSKLGTIEDGYNSSQSYIVTAVNGDAYLSIRKDNDTYVKVKFHPSLEAFTDIKIPDLTSEYDSTRVRDTPPHVYERHLVPASKFELFLSGIAMTKAQVLPLRQIKDKVKYTAPSVVNEYADDNNGFDDDDE
jgi:hypothetical protein